MTKTDIATPMRGFFEQHLLSQRGLSGHTVLAYVKPSIQTSGEMQLDDLSLMRLPAPAIHGNLMP